MHQIKPIRLSHVEPLLRDLFPAHPGPARQRHPGLWQGTGSRHLDLQNPVRLAVLRNLLRGQAPNGQWLIAPEHNAADRIVAWRFGFTLSTEELVQWPAKGLPPHQLHTAHVQAVAATLKDLDWRLAQLVYPRACEQGELFPSSVFATFRGRPSQPTHPRLTTTVYLLNLAPFSGSTNLPFTTTDLVRAARDLGLSYGCHLSNSLSVQEDLRPLRPIPLPYVSPAPSQETGRSLVPSPLVQSQSNVAPSPPCTQVRDYGHSH